MGPFSLAVASSALGALVFPYWGKYAALGLGMVSVALGAVAYRRPGLRLWGAAGITVGALAALLAGTQIVLTLVVLSRLAR